ncbi:hypothetical protein N9129_03305 [Akkermansiaceae bacterium]|nr:hypothetical protein [Akkermansiaceae bacterium]MDB4452221.1 hypothetical protein [Akkermansiaceae bacterium]
MATSNFMTDQPIEIDVQAIEDELKQLVPLKLSGDLLDRLDGAMSASQELIEIDDPEMELAELMPLVASDDLLDRLDAAMSRWHETVPVEEKVISLGEKPAEQSGKGVFLRWSSAAAVALFGASAALYFTQDGSPSPQQQRVSTQSSVAPGSPIALATFQPRNASAKVVDYHEGAVISNGNGQALRCVAVKVANEVSFRNANGEKVTVKKPQFKVIFVPVDVD